MSVTDQMGGIIGGFLASVMHNPGVEMAARLAVWGMVILWFVTVLWAFRDAVSRTHNVVAVLAAPAVVLVATPLGFPLAVLVWRILRPQQTVAEAHEQELTIEALRASTRSEACRGCRSRVEAEWRRCPWCRTWLLAPCPRCDRLVELTAAVCPWCVLDFAPGTLVPRVGAPTLAPARVPGLVPVMAVSPTTMPVMGPVVGPLAGAVAPEPVMATRHRPREEPAAAPSQPGPRPTLETAVAPAPPRRPRRSRGRSTAPEAGRTADDPIPDVARPTAMA